MSTNICIRFTIDVYRGSLLGAFKVGRVLLITSPINDRIPIVSSTSTFGRKLMGKTRPHTHNMGSFLWENCPHTHKFGGVSVPFIFMGNSLIYGCMDDLIVVRKFICFPVWVSNCLESKLWQFCRREVVDIWEIPYYIRKHRNGDNLPKNHSNDFIFTQKLDIDKIKFF